jgi:DNA primase large subunit
MNIRIIKEYYSNKKIREFLVEFGKDREVVSVYKDGKYGERPDVLISENDIISKVESGAIAFHCTAERYSNPMLLKPGMLKEEFDEIRIAWDLVIDIDVKDFEIAKISTRCICETLRAYGLKSFLVKYTGGDSFHILVFFESFPEILYNNKSIVKQYLEISKILIEFIKSESEEDLRRYLLENIGNPREIAEKVNKKIEEIYSNNKLDVFKVVNIDIFGLRHLFRMPYSLNEKTYLVSLPIEESEILKFKKSYALPQNVKDVIKIEKKKDGENLLFQALDWFSKKGVEVEIKELKEEVKKKKILKIPQEYFPPCIKKILSGLEDGRNRSIFVLATFLRNVGYEMSEIEKIIEEWNKRNKPPLRESIIRCQLRWHSKQQRNLLPPNCEHPIFYKDYGVCEPDEFCKNIKNPLTYAFKKFLSK